MKKLPFLLLLLLAWPILSACQLQETYSLKVILDGRHQIQAGERLDGQLYMLDGEVTLAPGASVDDAIYMLGGRLTIRGQVSGDVTTIGGDLVPGPQARIGGDVNLGGGTFQAAEGATVAGQINRGADARFPEAVSASRRPLLGQIGQAVAGAAAAAVLAYGAVRYAPRPVGRVSRAQEEHLLVALALGLLVLVVVPALLVMMAFTIVLIPVALVLVLLLILLTMYGWIGLGAALGRRLAGRLGSGGSPAVWAALGTLIVATVVSLLEAIPLAGFIALVLLVALALGAVLLTRLGWRTFVPAMEAGAVDLDGYRPA